MPVLKSETKVALEKALTELELARNQSTAQIELAMEHARIAMQQYVDDQQTPKKSTDSGGAVGHDPAEGPLNQGKSIIPNDGLVPRSKKVTAQVRKARLDAQLVRIHSRS